MKTDKSGTPGKRFNKTDKTKKSGKRVDKSKGRPRFDKKEKTDKPSEKRSYSDKKEYTDKPSEKRSYIDRKERTDKPSEKRPYGDRKERTDKPSEKRSYSDKKEYTDKPSEKRPYGDRKERTDKPSEKRPYGDKDKIDKPLKKRPRIEKTEAPEKDKDGYIRTRPDKYDRPEKKEYSDERPRYDKNEEKSDKYARPQSTFKNYDNKSDFKKKPASNRQIKETDAIRLNKYIANAGICSRRDADVLIQSGSVSINGKIITELGSKVLPGDKVTYDGRALINEKKVYLLLNKPKDYITTTEDPQDRRTVFALIADACRERIYPVGRLDRLTTGVLLFTNDGDMAKKLTHPRHGVRKVYHVVLDKALTKADMIQIVEGVELEDGIIDVDKISYIADGSDKKEIGIELHSGRNRVVRRLFETLGYTVTKLDRVSFAGLTKKDIKRGQWRFLTPKEISFLQMLK